MNFVYEYIFAFFVTGLVAAAVTYFEASGSPLLSGLAALFPIVTWVSYIFIGRIAGPEAVSRNALFVLLGTIFAWLPYMFIIYYFAPRLGSGRAITLALAMFLILAVIFVKIYQLK